MENSRMERKQEKSSSQSLGRYTLNTSMMTEQEDGGLGMTTGKQMYKFARKNHLGYNFMPPFQRLHFGRIARGLSDGEYAPYSFIGRLIPDINEIEKLERLKRAKRDSDGNIIEDGKDNRPVKFRWRHTSKWYAWVITNRGRLIYCRWELFNHAYTNLPLARINNINYQASIFWGTCKVEAFENNFGIFWTNNSAEKIYSILNAMYIKEHDSTVDLSTPTDNNKRTAPVDSVSDDLIKLKQLYDGHLISDDEYTSKKKEILSRM